MKLKTAGRSRRLDFTELGLIAAAAAVLALLWNTPLAFPLRYFSVLVHECSHAIAGILTGGVVDRIILNQETGGLTFIHGGNPIIFGSAGYIGSILFGCVVLYLSRFKNHAGQICMALGILLSVMTLLFVSPLFNGFGFLYGGLAGVTIAIIGRKFNGAATYFMKFLGVAVCLFGLMDIQHNLFSGASALSHSDAGILAQSTGIPAVIWAGAWLLISAIMLIIFGFLSATSIRRPIGFSSRTSTSRPAAAGTPA